MTRAVGHVEALLAVVPPGGGNQGRALEHALIGLAAHGTPGALGELRGAWRSFASDEARAIARALLDLAGDAETVEPAVVASRLDGPVLAELLAAARDAHDPGAIAVAIREAEAQRRAILAAARLGDGDRQALDELRRAVADLGAPAGRRSDRAPVLRCVADLVPRDVEWLVPDLIPAGEPALLAGPPGVGKSTLARALVAALSRGAPTPLLAGGSSSPREPVSVVMALAEDHAESVVRPSLERLGADLRRVALLEGRGDPDSPEPLALADEDTIGEALERTGARLLVVDPVVSFARGDTNRAAELRPQLQALKRACARTDAACLILSHTNKGTSRDSYRRVGGSGDLLAFVRHALLAGRDPDDDARGVVTIAKSNVAPIGGSLAYAVGGPEGFAWLGASSHGAADLLGEPDAPEDRAARSEARSFLGALLGAGPVAAADVARAAREHGLSQRDLAAAARALGVAREPVRTAGRIASWSWSLPGASDGRPAPAADDEPAWLVAGDAP